jgi:hypothetical protein
MECHATPGYCMATKEVSCDIRSGARINMWVKLVRERQAH